MKVSAQIKKYHMLLTLILGIFIVLGTRIYLADMPITDAWALQKAEKTLRPVAVENAMINYLVSQPTDAQVDAELGKLMKKYENDIEKESQRLKESYLDEQGNPYLYGIDPYHYYDQVKKKELSSLLPFTAYYLSRIFQGVPVTSILFWLPAIMTIIALVPIYLISRAVGGQAAALVSTVIFSIHPEFIKFSAAGMADTNTFNIFFIVLTPWLFYKCIESRKYAQLAYIASFLVMLALFAFTWKGYYVSIILSIVYLVLMACLYFYRIYTKKMKVSKRFAIIITIGLILLLVGLFGFNILLQIMPEKIQGYFGKTSESIWPDTFTRVNELQASSISEIIYRSGGLFFALIALYGVGAMIVNFVRSKKSDILGPIIILTATIFLIAGVKILRALPYSIPFVCIIFSIGFVYLLQYLGDHLSRILSIKDKWLVSGIVILILVTLPSFALHSNFKNAATKHPIVDDAIFAAASRIEQISDENDIIMTWWDRGHIFKAISEREVMVSASPQMPRTFWIAKALTAHDENYSRAIIHMLGCNKEKIVFKGTGLEQTKKIELLDRLMSLDKEAGKELLIENGLKGKIVNRLDCDSDDVYIVLTDDLLGKYHNIDYYSSWDFESGKVSPNSINRYDCSLDDGTYSCRIGSKTITINPAEGKTNFRPSKTIIVDNNVSAYSFNEPSTEKQLIIYKRATVYHAVLVEPEVAQSMFIRLFLLYGKGLENFEFVGEFVRPETARVLVYRVIWK